MWFASKKGLYRYDGYTIISYKNNPLNPSSLESNSLESMCIDSSGIIWIGTFGSGLDRFDPATESFTHFHHDPGNSESLDNDTVSVIGRVILNLINNAFYAVGEKKNSGLTDTSRLFQLLQRKKETR